LVVRLRAHPEVPAHLADLSGVPELKGVGRVRTPGGEALEIGAMTTFSELEGHPEVLRWAPALTQAAASVGSAQIRNLGTLGGNVANASPAADSLPVLACLEASTLVEGTDGRGGWRPLEALIAAPGRTALRPGEYLRAFRIPLRPGSWSAFRKLGSRRAVSISRINLALRVGPEGSRLFLGALGALPIRCPEGERALGLPPGPGREAALLEALTRTVDSAIPGRSSRAYKRQAVRGLGADLLADLEGAGR
jgi:carbon-monoxide dehydrogenase medium subunit